MPDHRIHRMSATDLRACISEVLNRIAYRGERWVVERRGRELVALISLEDLRKLEEWEEAQRG